MQYTLNTHNIRHLLSKHNTVTTPHSHMCNPISYVNSPARLRCAGGEINRIHSSVHSQFIGNRNSNSSAVSSHAKRLLVAIWHMESIGKVLIHSKERTIACADCRWLGLCGIILEQVSSVCCCLPLQPGLQHQSFVCSVT